MFMKMRSDTRKKSLFCAVAVVLCVDAFSFPAFSADLKSIMESHKDEIITECREYGIWPSAVVGMAGVESGYASVSALAGVYNNYWGLSRSAYIANLIPCGSVYGGFAAFPTFSDGLHAYLIWFWQGNYPGVASVLRNLNSTPEQMYSAVIASGYMTGTAGYYEGIIAHAKAVGADEWDKLAFPDGRKYIPYVEGMPDSVQVGTYDYPADRYNPHAQVERLLTERPMESDERLSYDQLQGERDLNDQQAGRIQSEQRIGEEEEEGEETPSSGSTSQAAERLSLQMQ